MEIILKQDVANLGYADDLVKVKDGYARNYLIPQGYAELATPAKTVNNIMVADALKAQHDIEIDRHKIAINEDRIKELGQYTATVNLHREFKVELKLNVVREEAE